MIYVYVCLLIVASVVVYNTLPEQQAQAQHAHTEQGFAREQAPPRQDEAGPVPPRQAPPRQAPPRHAPPGQGAAEETPRAGQRLRNVLRNENNNPAELTVRRGTFVAFRDLADSNLVGISQGEPQVDRYGDKHVMLWCFDGEQFASMRFALGEVTAPVWRDPPQKKSMEQILSDMQRGLPMSTWVPETLTTQQKVAIVVLTSVVKRVIGGDLDRFFKDPSDLLIKLIGALIYQHFGHFGMLFAAELDQGLTRHLERAWSGIGQFRS